jgi:hypothetical protein
MGSLESQIKAYKPAEGVARRWLQDYFDRKPVTNFQTQRMQRTITELKRLTQSSTLINTE